MNIQEISNLREVTQAQLHLLLWDQYTPLGIIFISMLVQQWKELG